MSTKKMYSVKLLARDFLIGYWGALCIGFLLTCPKEDYFKARAWSNYVSSRDEQLSLFLEEVCRVTGLVIQELKPKDYPPPWELNESLEISALRFELTVLLNRPISQEDAVNKLLHEEALNRAFSKMLEVFFAAAYCFGNSRENTSISTKNVFARLGKALTGNSNFWDSLIPIALAELATKPSDDREYKLFLEKTLENFNSDNRQ